MLKNVIKAAWGLGFAVIYSILCFLTGAAKAKNKQLEKELQDEQDAQKFSQNLDRTGIDVKRKWLRDNFRKKNG